MAPDQVREALDTLPFRPFIVQIAGGKRVPIKHPDYAWLTPSGRTLVVATNDRDAVEMIDVFLITNLSFNGSKATRRK